MHITNTITIKNSGQADDHAAIFVDGVKIVTTSAGWGSNSLALWEDGMPTGVNGQGAVAALVDTGMDYNIARVLVDQYISFDGFDERKIRCAAENALCDSRMFSRDMYFDHQGVLCEEQC